MVPLRAALVIGVTTLLEALRNRILMITVAFAVALIGFSVATAAVSIGEQARLIIDVGIAAASALGGLITVALTIGSFGREIQQRTAYPVLARPLPRWTFVLGKFAGLWATAVLVVTLMVLATAAAVWLFGASLPQTFWPSLYLLWLEMAIIVGIALLFSCYTTPMLAATYAIAVIIAGNLAQDLTHVAARIAEKQPIVASVLRLAYGVLPDLARVSLRVQAANDLEAPAGFLFWATAYAGAYAAATLALAMLLFTRKKAI